MLKALSGLFAGVLLISIFSFAVMPDARAVMLDRVLVVVNDDIITLGEFQAAMGSMRNNLASAGEQMPPENVLEEKVLEQLVFEKLLQLHAVETGVNVTDAMLDLAMENLAQQNNMSVPQVLEQLRKDGINEEEFKQSLKDQLLVQRVIERDVKQAISVTDGEVDGVLRSVSKVQPDQDLLYFEYPASSE